MTVITRLYDAGFKVFACLPVGDSSTLASDLNRKAKDANRLIILRMDRKERHSIDECISKVRQSVTQGEEIWGLVTLSGFPLQRKIDWSNFDTDFKQVVDGDIVGLLHLVRECLPLLREFKGRIVNLTGSSNGEKGPSVGCTSAISRSTSRSLMECVRREVAYFGIDVMNVDDDSGLHIIPTSPSDQAGQQLEEEKRASAIEIAACVEQGLRAPFPEYTYSVSPAKQPLKWLQSLVSQS